MILSHSPTEIRNDVFDHIDIDFNEAIDATSISVDDVMISGPDPSVFATDVQHVAGNTYRVRFDPLTVRGTYRAIIGPNVTDIDGNPMDQNEDGFNGDPVLDLYAASFVYIDADAIFTTATLITEGDTTYDGLDILVDGAIVTIDGPHNFNSVHIIGAGVLTHSANTTTETHKLDISVAEQVSIDATSRIDVSGKGYLRGVASGATGRTTGNTTVGGASYSAGASYGGLGGKLHELDEPNRTYGDYRDPDDWGSGGANNGGDGGGLVRIQAATLVLEGALLANGDDGHGGGGSGGGIFLTATILTGDGVITAKGGAASSSGGGGRVAVYAEDYTTFNLDSISAAAGIGVSSAGGTGTVYIRDTDESKGTLIIDAKTGGSGLTPLGLPGSDTFIISDDVLIRGLKTNVRSEHAGLEITFDGSLTIEDSAKLELVGNAQFATDAPVSVTGNARVDVKGNLVFESTVGPVGVTDNAVLHVDGNAVLHKSVGLNSGGLIEVLGTLTSDPALTIDGATLAAGRVLAPSLSVINNGLLTSIESTATQMHKLELNVAGTLLVDATSRIDVSGKGYLRGVASGATGRTTGNTTVGGAFSSAGGSYGGLGGKFSAIDEPNRTYGDYRDPDDWGSGGANNGGDGGGLVRIQAATLVLEGALLANGDDGHGGGGSGGGIFLAATTLTGDGVITVKGGAASRGGGGGRVAVYAEDYTTFNLDSISAAAGIGVSAASESGTVYVVQGRPHTHVLEHGPVGDNGYIFSELDHVELRFNRQIDLVAFQPADFQIQGPLGPVSVADVSLIGDRKYRFGFSPLSENGYYQLTLLPTLLDAEGIHLDQNANGIAGESNDTYEFTMVLDTVAPQVKTYSPQGDITGTINYLDVSFSEAIDRTTFTSADVAVADPDGNSIAVTSVNEVGFNRFRIGFATLSVNGQYHVSIGPDVRDLAGNQLDIDGDDVFGEPTDDIYDASFNFVPVDLELTSITVNNTTLVAGQSVSLSWQGRNATGAALLGDWTDAVYLSLDDNWDITDKLIATVDHVGGLADGEEYSASASGFVPGALPGQYHILVRADVFNVEKEFNREGNNVLASSPLALTVLQMPTDGTLVNGQLTSADRADYYQFRLEGGESLQTHLNSLSAHAISELYVSYAAIPTRQQYNHRSATPSTTQDIELTGIATGGTYYVLVYGSYTPGPVDYNLSAEKAPFFVSKISPTSHGNASPAVITITGVGFDETTTVALLKSGGAVHPQPVQFLSSTTLKITELTFLDPGQYTVRIVKDGIITELPDAFKVLEDGEAKLVINLAGPSALALGVPVKQTYWIEYRNAGTIAMAAPLLQFSVGSPGLVTADEAFANSIVRSRVFPNGIPSSVQVLGVGSGATPGILQPGDSGRIPVYYLGNPEFKSSETFSLGSLTSLDTTEQVAYLLGPTERVVFDRPAHGDRNIAVNTAIEPFHVIRDPANTTGTSITRHPGTSVPGPGGFVGVVFPPANVFEENLYIDWTKIRNDRPDSIPSEVWDSILYNLHNRIGDWWADYVEEIAANANYLATVGQTTNSVAELWNFEVAQASAILSPIQYLSGAVDVSIPTPGLALSFSRVYGQSMVSRFDTGVFGRGWTHNWDIKAERQDSNVVLHGPGGVDRFFVLNSDGTYSASPGDFGQLTHSNGEFELVEPDQTIWHFGEFDQLEYVEDTNGNRITLAYDGVLLTSITHSNGREILLEYGTSEDGKQYLVRAIDPVGPGTEDDRVTSYRYTTGQIVFIPEDPHLMQVIAPGDRVTEYSYISPPDVTFNVTGPRGNTKATSVSILAFTASDPRSHALVSIAHPDGTHDYFDYDGGGNLIGTQKDNGLEQVTFGRNSAGTVVVTDAAGRETWLDFGLGGQLAQVRDADGRIVGFGYDSKFQFDELAGPGGEQSEYEYDDSGNLVNIVDALNLQTSFEYESNFNQLESFTDPRGNGIDYQFDDRGNLIAIVYVDESQETFTYDAFGNVLTSTNRRDQTVTYTYNPDGQVTSKDYDTSPGIEYVYTYNTAGNLKSATDALGVTLMTYYPETDFLKRIDYPGGKFFEFEYDEVGRRTRRTDQTGDVVNYSYDEIGRLNQLTDGSNSLIVDYDYDDAGRISRKTLGNGVYTTYQYDPAGNVLQLRNMRPDDTILSRFDYTYDISGRRDSMTTLEGTYEYGYDAIGQLTAVRHPDGHIVSYDYDAAGNRRQVIDDGVVETYITNDLNQYVTVGGVDYVYDLDGNLISKTEAGITTTYTYDIENHLVGVDTPSDSWVYTYDVFGNRVTTTHNGDATEYVIDPIGLGNVAAEYDNTGDLIAQYDHGYGLVARTDDLGAAAFYTFSAIGNTSEVTDVAATTLNSYVYDPFGVSLDKSESISNSFEFVGEFGVMNEANGLEFMRARYFDGDIGRFHQHDPIGILGGFNTYSYAANDPVTKNDASGLKVNWGTVRGGFGTVLGGTINLRGGPLTAIQGAWQIGVGIGNVINGLIDQNPVLTGSLLTDPIRPFTTDPDVTAILDVVDLTKSLTSYESPTDKYESIAELIDLFELLNLNHDVYTNLLPLVWDPFAPIQISSRFVVPRDPNDKLAPSGYGEAHFIPSDNSLDYTIRFENMPVATGPAREIFVTDVFDDDLDLDTLELTEIKFANKILAIPPGMDHFEASVPFTANGEDFFVHVLVELDRDSRQLSLTLRAIDPLTGWVPENALTGILYPNDEAGRGEGHISFAVKPREGLPSGTEIINRASIIFDFNDPIETPQVLNSLDAGVPMSSVAALPALSAEWTFDVTWSGDDELNGSGISSYDVYISSNGIDYTLWLRDFPGTSMSFTGIPGTLYSFYSQARDNVGHVEAAPLVADATITVLRTHATITSPAATTQLMRPLIEWTPVDEAVSYDVWISNLSTNQSPMIRAQVSGTSFIPAQDLGIGQFRVWVRGQYDDGSYSVWSLPSDFAVNTQAAFLSLPPDFATGFPTLEWSSIPGAAKYDVWIDNVSTGQLQFVRKQDVAATTFIPETELPLGRYRIWVRAIDAGDKPALWSVSASFAILTRPNVLSPSPATFLIRPEFTWSPIPGATHYELWVDNVSTGVSKFIYEPHLATASFIPLSDMPDGNYRYWVRAFGPGGMSGRYSAERSLHVGGRPSVTAPTGATSTSSPIILWTSVDGAAGYDLWVNRTDVPQSQIIRQQNLTTTEFQTSMLAQGVYLVWVRAFTAGEVYSDWSKPFSFSISAVAASTPTLLTPAASTFDATPIFHWTTIEAATHYRLFVRNLVTLDVPILEPELLADSFTPVTDLMPGAYRAWVRAYAASAALGNWSTPVDFTVIGPPVLTIDQSGLAGIPLFSWTPVPLAIKYELLVDRLDVPTNGVISETNLTDVSFVPASPLGTGAYRAWIRAVSTTSGTTAWSDAVDFNIAVQDSGDDEFLFALLTDQLVRASLPRLGIETGAARQWKHEGNVDVERQRVASPDSSEALRNSVTREAADAMVAIPSTRQRAESQLATNHASIASNELRNQVLEVDLIESVLEELALGSKL